MALLQLYNAQKSFGKREILKRVSFSVETGEVLGIFGRNGCGKSTLLKMLFGTMSSDLLDFEIDGKKVNASQVIPKQLMGYVPQHPFLPKSLKVRDVILTCYQDEKQQDTVFYNSGVAKLTHKRVGELSLGELKYFEVILLGASTHPFLLFDEPFSMVDPMMKENMKTFFLEIKKEKGIMLTDHYYDDVLQTTSKNIVIKDGISHHIRTESDLKKFEYLSNSRC
ncbi:ATP-binding cassette domain-containing protein [Jejudonia soesokkakensis]|uniref:ATP-binding cassette domain-containing protein n=1 Tax=Jejudonia soesokkakensis TaxID=1323432 RepID=A0ABW2MUS2_9FLAO